MRMENSWSRDVAMSTSTNLETCMTYALFHGCDEQDVKVLTHWLQLTPNSAGHPMLLPAFFAEMQLRRHKKLAEDNWTKLIKLYAQTGQYGSPALQPRQNGVHEGTSDHVQITREVLEMHQDTGFLEKSLLNFQRRLRQMLPHSTDFESKVAERHKQFVSIEGARIVERLEEMSDQYHGLVEECRLVKEGASMLTGAVSVPWSMKGRWER